MGRKGHIILLVQVLLVGFMYVPLPRAAAAAGLEPLPAALTDGRFGFVEAYVAPDLARRAGAGWERLLFSWNDIQPGGPQDWNPFWFQDSILQGELARGITVVGVLLNTPAWARSNPAHGPAAVPKGLYLHPLHPDNTWGRFVGQIVRRYAGRIDHWIIWNEPDIRPQDSNSTYFTWAGSEADYYQLLKVAYQAARAVNPRVKIGFAGLSYWNDVVYGRRLFLDRVLEFASRDPAAAANGYFFDFAALHLYMSPESLYDAPTAVKRVLAAHRLQKPIWITETNTVPYDDPVAPLPPTNMRTTLDGQASYIIQASLMALAAGVERIGVYRLMDGRGEHGAAAALVRSDGSIRPAFLAYQTVTRYLANARAVIRQTINEVETFVVDKGSQRITVLWNASPLPVTVTLKARGTSARLVTKLGQESPLRATGGVYTLPLARATTNTDPERPDWFLVGGDPLLVVEEGLTPAEQADTRVILGGADLEYFPQTGYSVYHTFLRYFREKGGVDQFGYPRSRPRTENGILVQYFQRARFEYHPDKAGTPQEVQLSPLGDWLTKKNQPFPRVAPFQSWEQGRYFPETGHGVYYAFLKYYDAHGGRERFGLPLSEETLEPNGDMTGRAYVVQWFEKARMEYHPEHAGTPYEVQLGLLGDHYLVSLGRLRHCGGQWWAERC